MLSALCGMLPLHQALIFVIQTQFKCTLSAKMADTPRAGCQSDSGSSGIPCTPVLLPTPQHPGFQEEKLPQGTKGMTRVKLTSRNVL